MLQKREPLFIAAITLNSTINSFLIAICRQALKTYFKQKQSQAKY